MVFIYNLVVRSYYLFVLIASLFNKKAKLWIAGRKERPFIRFTDSIWFHFASLGEFEQGRPVLEALRAKYPDNKFVITFFSPSGYEVRKNTLLADAVYCLPLDTRQNAREFIDVIQPKLAVFTKYEYWYYFFAEAHRRNIPVYLVSGIFRPGQIFFKWYGGLHRKMLGFISWFFVQDENSKALLYKIGIDRVTVSGDTRFDRVLANAQQPKSIPGIDEFKSGHKVFIAGSTWPADEKLIAGLVNQYPDWKFIIAPHETGKEKIENLTGILPAGTFIKYSELTAHPDDYRDAPHNATQVLIIDNIGMLSSLYQYGEIAYIGGGFGAGIHNTLEAAAFGLPVIFGPNYDKFIEAKELIACKAGFSINDETGLKAITDALIKADSFEHAGAKASAFVKTNVGATATVISQIIKDTDGLS